MKKMKKKLTGRTKPPATQKKKKKKMWIQWKLSSSSRLKPLGQKMRNYVWRLSDLSVAGLWLFSLHVTVDSSSIRTWSRHDSCDKQDSDISVVAIPGQSSRKTVIKKKYILKNQPKTKNTTP